MKENDEKINTDIKKLYNYPSIGKLFSTPDLKNLTNIKTKLNSSREKLDSLVRRGSPEEAMRASKAVNAIQTTLNFLRELEENHQNQEI